jgi:hypothetical protein
MFGIDCNWITWWLLFFKFNNEPYVIFFLKKITLVGIQNINHCCNSNLIRSFCDPKFSKFSLLINLLEDSSWLEVFFYILEIPFNYRSTSLSQTSYSRLSFEIYWGTTKFSCIFVLVPWLGFLRVLVIFFLFRLIQSPLFLATKTVTMNKRSSEIFWVTLCLLRLVSLWTTILQAAFFADKLQEFKTKSTQSVPVQDNNFFDLSKIDLVLKR